MINDTVILCFEKKKALMKLVILATAMGMGSLDGVGMVCCEMLLSASTCR